MEDGTIEGPKDNPTTVERFTLNNGVRVISEEIPWVSSVAIGFLVLVGATYESKRINGITHFLEHMVFKGTERRSARDIVMEIESLGGVINAATGKEFTNYYVRIYHKHLEEAIDILIDIIFKPHFDTFDIKREKGVVIEEIKMGEDNPDEFIIEKFHRNVYGDTSLGRKIAGSEKSITALTREDIVSYHGLHYRPSNLVISVAGRVKGNEIKELLEKSFKNAGLWKKAHSRRSSLPRIRPRFRPARFELFKDVEQTTLLLGYPSVSIFDPDRYTFALVDTHLAGGMSSRLFQEVREKRGLVYSIDSNQTPMAKAGLYTVEAGMTGGNTSKVAKVIAREINRIAGKGIPRKGLNNAREYLKGVMLLALENTTARMTRNVVNEIYFRRQIPLSELTAALDKVKTADTQAVAKRIFNPDNLAVGILTSNRMKGTGNILLKAVCREFTAN